MRKIYLIAAVFLVLIASSCSVQKYLPQGERLYKGATVKVEKNKETTTTVKSLKKTIALAASPKPNKFLLGQPYKVWFYYKIGEPKREKGLRAFLRNRLGEPPVLSSRVNAKATAENMASLMDNLGYFHTTVQGDTVHTGSYFVKALYTAQVQPQYKLGPIKWVGDSSSALQKLLDRNSTRNGLLKTGNPYRLSDITTERDRLDLFLKTRGYYFFNPDYLMAYADSTVGGRKVNLYLNIKTTTPEDAKHPYTINSITVFPNYSLTSPDLDTSKRGVEIFDGLRIKDTIKNFKKNLFAQTITYRPGSIYSSRQQNTTLNRFINLGAFKFVKNRFEEVKHTDVNDTSHTMNVYYYLTPAKQKSIQAQVDGFTKENNFKEVKKNIYLLPIEAGQRMTLNSVFFEQSKAVIIDTSFPELDRIVKAMKENPTMEIMLEGHTDNQGDWNANLLLSKERVEQVQKYLASKGIIMKRIQVQGYGSTRPVASNNSEEKRRLNRRVEVTIVKN